MEIAKVIERGWKDTLPALRNVPNKKLLEETAIILQKKTHKTTKTNELFYA